MGKNGVLHTTDLFQSPETLNTEVRISPKHNQDCTPYRNNKDNDNPVQKLGIYLRKWILEGKCEVAMVLTR